MFLEDLALKEDRESEASRERRASRDLSGSGETLVMQDQEEAPEDRVNTEHPGDAGSLGTKANLADRALLELEVSREKQEQRDHKAPQDQWDHQVKKEIRDFQEGLARREEKESQEPRALLATGVAEAHVDTRAHLVLKGALALVDQLDLWALAEGVDRGEEKGSLEHQLIVGMTESLESKENLVQRARLE